MTLFEKIQAKTREPGSFPPVKLAFLGDSVTHGCFEVVEKGDGRADCVYDHEAVYHSHLKRQLEAAFPNCPVTVINAGISGCTAAQGAQRTRRDVLDARPDLTVVCFGLNDVMQEGGPEAYVLGLQTIFLQLKEAGIPALFMTPNMLCTYACPQLPDGWLRRTGEACAAAQNGGRMDAFMAAALTLCEQKRVPVCDCYRDWKRLEALGADIPYLLANHINHPTRDMHALFANRLFETILLKEVAGL